MVLLFPLSLSRSGVQGVPINFLHIVVGRDAFPGITDRTLFYNTDSELQQAPWARISKLTSRGGGLGRWGVVCTLKLRQLLKQVSQNVISL